MNSTSLDVSKKRYQKPDLKVYGDIEGLTASVSNTSSNMDAGGGGTMTKTH